MQRLAYALVALLLASAFTGCTWLNRGSANPEESIDRPGFRKDNAASGDFEVIVADGKFTPTHSWVTENTTIAFTNGAYGTHSAVGDNGAWNTGGITPQSSVPIFFDKHGDYTYRCGYHSNMTGVIHVL
jgi:plastocyanin